MACTCGPQVTALTEELKTCNAIVQVFGQIICTDARLASSLARFTHDESLPLQVRSVLQSLNTATPDTALSNAVQTADKATEQVPATPSDASNTSVSAVPAGNTSGDLAPAPRLQSHDKNPPSAPFRNTSAPSSAPAAEQIAAVQSPLGDVDGNEAITVDEVCTLLASCSLYADEDDVLHAELVRLHRRYPSRYLVPSISMVTFSGLDGAFAVPTKVVKTRIRDRNTPVDQAPSVTTQEVVTEGVQTVQGSAVSDSAMGGDEPPMDQVRNAASDNAGPASVQVTHEIAVALSAMERDETTAAQALNGLANQGVLDSVLVTRESIAYSSAMEVDEISARGGATFAVDDTDMDDSSSQAEPDQAVTSEVMMVDPAADEPLFSAMPMDFEGSSDGSYVNFGASRDSQEESLSCSPLSSIQSPTEFLSFSADDGFEAQWSIYDSYQPSIEGEASSRAHSRALPAAETTNTPYYPSDEGAIYSTTLGPVFEDFYAPDTWSPAPAWPDYAFPIHLPALDSGPVISSTAYNPYLSETTTTIPIVNVNSSVQKVGAATYYNSIATPSAQDVEAAVVPSYEISAIANLPGNRSDDSTIIATANHVVSASSSQVPLDQTSFVGVANPDMADSSGRTDVSNNMFEAESNSHAESSTEIGSNTHAESNSEIQGNPQAESTEAQGNPQPESTEVQRNAHAEGVEARLNTQAENTTEVGGNDPPSPDQSLALSPIQSYINPFSLWEDCIEQLEPRFLANPEDPDAPRTIFAEDIDSVHYLMTLPSLITAEMNKGYADELRETVLQIEEDACYYDSMPQMLRDFAMQLRKTWINSGCTSFNRKKLRKETTNAANLVYELKKPVPRDNKRDQSTARQGDDSSEDVDEALPPARVPRLQAE